MAEVLGTVVGVISLGLQLCSGINTYLEGVQCRKEDIESTIRNVQSVESTLKQIQSDQDRHSAPDSANEAILKAMSNAKVELSLLDEFVGKIYASVGSSTPRTVRDKINEQKQKFLYPFRRDHLDRLNGRLYAANEALQAALQTLQINILSENNASLKGLATGVDSMSTGLQEMRLEVRKGLEEGSVLLSAVRQENIAFRDDIVTLVATALSSPSPMAAVQTLASQPSGLNMLCDDMKVCQPPDRSGQLPGSESGQANNFYSKLQCRCKLRRISRRKKRQLGPAFLLEETVREYEHDVGCLFAVPNETVNNKWSAGITVKAFQTLVSTAVTITMSTAFGAGGYGISPTFTYFHVHDRSPAFRLIELLQGAITFDEWSENESEELIRRGIGTLRAIFDKKRSSPFDVDPSGATLLHSACWALPYSWHRPRNVLLKYLVDAVRVPKDHPDSTGRLPFQTALRSSSWNHDHESLGLQAVDILVPEETILAFDIQEIDSNTATLNHLTRHLTVAKGSLKMATMYAGHPTEAIFLRGEKGLLEVLKKTTSMLDLSAVDASGHTALHHLVGWHEGLSMVLKKFGESILQVYDISETSALQVALYWSGHLCASPSSVRCSEACSCAATVKLLLEVNEDCLIRAVSRKFFLVALCEASAKARDLVIDELTNRRQALKHFATSELEPAHVDRFDLRHPKVLDLHIRNVLKELHRAGKVIPRDLHTEIFDDKETSISVYHQLGWIDRDIRPLADSFYSRGFHDIDTPSPERCTPLLSSLHAQHSAWLIEHGASLEVERPGEISGYTAAHYLFTRTDRHELGTEDMKSKLLDILRSRVGEEWCLDNCTCACSSNGCHPYTAMWKAVLPLFSQHDKALDKITKNIHRNCVKLEEGWTVPRALKSVSLRVCTFAVLPLRHTCCSHWGKGPESSSYYFSFGPLREYEQDEIEEIHEEDAAEIARLENLLVEFEEKIDQMGCSLAEFFQTYWKDRMEEVLLDIENQMITAEEIEGARKLGVMLQVQPAEAVTEQREDTSSLQYWTQMMDALVQ